MTSNDAIEQLKQDAYAAALDPIEWAAWSARAGALMEGICTSFYILEAGSAKILHQNIQHPSAKAIERYMSEEIWRLDPQAPYVARNPRHHVYTDTDHLDLQDPATRDYIAWQKSNSDLRHYLTACLPIGRGLLGGLSVHRKVPDGATPVHTRKVMTALAPDLGRALQLGFIHAEKLASAQWDGLLTARAEPSLLLDEGGKLLRCTSTAADLLDRRDGLDISGSRLIARDPMSDDALQAMIGRALVRDRPQGGSARVARRPPRAGLIISAFPLVRRARHLAAAEAAALITLVDPSTATRSSGDGWRQAFGLTVRETELAVLLAGGHSLESAAAAMQASRNTAKIHLARLFTKTGCNRQAELLRLLARIT